MRVPQGKEHSTTALPTTVAQRWAPPYSVPGRPGSGLLVERGAKTLQPTRVACRSHHDRGRFTQPDIFSTPRRTRFTHSRSHRAPASGTQPQRVSRRSRIFVSLWHYTLESRPCAALRKCPCGTKIQLPETSKNAEILLGLKNRGYFPPCFHPIRNKGEILQGIQLIGPPDGNEVRYTAFNNHTLNSPLPDGSEGSAFLGYDTLKHFDPLQCLAGVRAQCL